jgi:hypothetical protein
VGDAAAHPIKQGGLAAQQADLAVADVLARLDGRPRPPVPTPVLRGALLTPDGPRYLRTPLGGDAPITGEYAPQALWWPPGKIAGRHLAPRLAAGRGVQQRRTLAERDPVPAEARLIDAERDEAQELLLRQASLDAHLGDLAAALRALDAAESVTGYLPPYWAERRHQWHAAEGSTPRR